MYDQCLSNSHPPWFARSITSSQPGTDAAACGRYLKALSAKLLPMVSSFISFAMSVENADAKSSAIIRIFLMLV